MQPVTKDIFGPVLAVVYEAAGSCTEHVAALSTPRGRYAPPRMCQYPAGEVRPQPHTKRAARVDVSPVLELHPVAPLLPQIPPHMRASMYGASGISTVACTLATASYTRTPPR